MHVGERGDQGAHLVRACGAAAREEGVNYLAGSWVAHYLRVIVAGALAVSLHPLEGVVGVVVNRQRVPVEDACEDGRVGRFAGALWIDDCE